MSMREFMACLTCALVVGSVLPLYGQQAPRQTLVTAKSASCVFIVVATAEWRNGDPSGDVKSARMTIQFDSIDADDGTAQALGPLGTSEIIVKASPNAIHFLQAFRDGPLHVTTVFNSASHAGKLKAVHTRHEFSDIALPGFTSTPEQYYGECEVQP